MIPIDGLRPSVLPVEHLEAELLAAPLASPAAFRAALVALDPRVLRGGTGDLWRDVERDLLSRFPGMSVDELVLRRDRVWFGHAEEARGGELPLAGVLRSAARALVDVGSGTARVRSDGGTERRAQRRRFRWLSFALPADLLLAAADAEQERLDQIPSALHLTLAERGLAETHLHLKAAIGFPALWASLMRALAELTATADMLASPGGEIDEGRGLAPWLLRAALARLLLAGFLRSASARRAGFAAYLRDRVIPRVASLSGPLAATTLATVVGELAGARLGRRSPEFGPLRALYAALTDLPARPPPRSAAEIPTLDPLHWWFPAEREASPEFRFTRAALAYLDDATGARDPPFARLFWQCERLRTRFYRHVVQRPLTPGLQWFTRTYARLSPARQPLPLGVFLDEAARLGGAGLRSLEVRLTPERSVSELLGSVRELDDARRRIPSEVGVVFHFPRMRGGGADRGLPAAWGRRGHEQPDYLDANPTGYRFGGYYIERRAEAAALASMLLSFPRTLELVRGVDLCTDELAVPLWVVRPLVEHVRRAAGLAASALRDGARQRVRPFGLTVHAGEDFVHLLGGLRRMGETIEFLDMTEGDRIGHGVALGVEVEAWAARSTGLAVPRGERLLDLIWASRVASRAGGDMLRSWLPWIDREIARLGSAIFGPELASLPLQLAGWVEALHATRELVAARFPDGPPPRAAGGGVRALVIRWLTDPVVYRRAQRLEEIDVTREIPLVAALQTAVRSVVAHRGVVIELNPSSNLLIGNLGDLTHHPLWRLAPPWSREPDAPRVRVCVGSDDPITFATQLQDEYQLLHDAMVEGGVSAHHADAWIEAARAHGLAARFTQPASGAPLEWPMFPGGLPIAP